MGPVLWTPSEAAPTLATVTRRWKSTVPRREPGRRRRALDATGPTLGDFIRHTSAAGAGASDPPPAAATTSDMPVPHTGFPAEDEEGGEAPAGATADLGATSFHAFRRDGGRGRRRVFIETHGCQMNVADTQVLEAVLQQAGYETVAAVQDADAALVNTCAIRDNAEAKVWHRLSELRAMKRRRPPSQPLIVGVLGCMAERLKTQLLESDRMVDLVAGPDAYRDLPNLITIVEGGEQAINVQLSQDETYADITPVRKEGGVSGYLSIQRGCDNFCAFCIGACEGGTGCMQPPLLTSGVAGCVFYLQFHERAAGNAAGPCKVSSTRCCICTTRGSETSCCWAKTSTPSTTSHPPKCTPGTKRPPGFPTTGPAVAAPAPGSSTCWTPCRRLLRRCASGSPARTRRTSPTTCCT